MWTDNVYFTATATASSFDLQGRAGTTGTWLDVGIPGDSDTTPIVLTGVGLDTLSPSATVTVPFQLCNVGTAAGTVTAVSTPVVTGPLATTAGAAMTVTVTAADRRSGAAVRFGMRDAGERNAHGHHDRGLPACCTRGIGDDHLQCDRNLQLSRG